MAYGPWTSCPACGGSLAVVEIDEVDHDRWCPSCGENLSVRLARERAAAEG
jgi:predicted RNA-binding Zn-ribbon protein involved in translation (DUF1610 family)